LTVAFGVGTSPFVLCHSYHGGQTAMTKTAHFRFSTAVLRRLGEELNPNPDQGILELVKNAFDANARSCSVELENVIEPGGVLRVVDDGDGMDESEIESRWLLLGASDKERLGLTRLGRRPVGSKGLGRLAALRLGNSVELVTRPRSHPQSEFSLAIEWALFDAAATVEAVDLVIQEQPRGASAADGTHLEVRGLRNALRPADVKRLARSMVLLADPFEHERGFRPQLLAPEFKALESLVSRKYFDFADHHLSARVAADGSVMVQVLDSAGRGLAATTSPDRRDTDRRYRCPPAEFDLWAFRVESRGDLIPGGPTIGELRAWLGTVGGVHVYQDGIRVGPYGDDGHDWLGMNLRRAQNPELRPSTNTAVGRIRLTGSRSALTQKTDRSGFIEDEAFHELRHFAVDSLEWMARWRMKQRENRREQTKLELPKQIKEAAESVRSVIEQIPARLAQRRRLELVFKQYEKQRERRDRELEREVLLYRALCTVGTTAATFAHESRKPLTNIVRAATVVDGIGQAKRGLLYQGDFQKQIELISRSARGLQSFTRVTTRLLDHDKRRKGRVEWDDSIKEVVDLLKPHIERMGISITVELCPGRPAIHGTPAAFEAILMNLLTNAMNAIRRQRDTKRERRILVRTSVAETFGRIEVLDSGPGIRDLPLEDIWLPGQTTTPHGTGLGLTIVRDCAHDLGGRATAAIEGALGGAHFTIELPLL
jgi:signal transduction histidine kinase